MYPYLLHVLFQEIKYNSFCIFLGMLEKWQILEEKADEQGKVCSLRKNIKDLHEWLLDFTNKMPNMTLNINDRDQLERNIRLVKVRTTRSICSSI